MSTTPKVYSAPKLVRLRLADYVAHDAAQWWKVENEFDRLTVKYESLGGDDFYRELGSFIVKLVKG